MGTPRSAAEATEGPRDAGGAPGIGQDHDVAAPEHWPWLPTQDDDGLARHPYCEECGAIKAIGRDAGLDFGTLVNILSTLERRLRDHGHRVTEAQHRLILKRLRIHEADDGFAMPRSGQLDQLAEAVATYTGLDQDHVRALMRSC